MLIHKINSVKARNGFKPVDQRTKYKPILKISNTICQSLWTKNGICKQ